VKIWLKIALNAVRLPKFETVKGISWSPRKITVKGLQQRSGLPRFCACAESCVVFNTGPYTVLPDNSILITANIQSEIHVVKNIIFFVLFKYIGFVLTLYVYFRRYICCVFTVNNRK